jgi:hypothetical protein
LGDDEGDRRNFFVPYRQEQKEQNMKETFRKNLVSLQGEFFRLSKVYPALYHQQLLVDPTAHEMTKANWEAFAAANTPCPHGAWQAWHGPYEGKDFEWFGRFSGGEQGVTEFKQMAESLYLVFRMIDPHLPKTVGYAGCLQLMHEMATNWPTPLLRSTESLWGMDTDDWASAMVWTQIDKQTGFAPHPFVETVENNLFSATVAAIEMVIDDDSTLFLSDMHFDKPDYPVLPEAQRPVDTGDERVTKRPKPNVGTEPATASLPVQSQSEHHGEHHPLLFQLVNDMWHITFTDKEGTETGTPHQGKDKGFRYYQYLLQHPDTKVGYKDLVGRERPASVVSRSSISAEEHMSMGQEEEPFQAGRSIMEWKDSAYRKALAEELDSLENQKEYEESQAGPEHRQQAKQLEKEINVLLAHSNAKVKEAMLSPAVKLDKRSAVKAMRQSLAKLRQGKAPMDRFVQYLEQTVLFHDAPGICAYRPQRRPDIDPLWHF